MKKTSPSQEVAARLTVVLDTSVLMGSPAALSGFPGADIVLPLTVIDELDANKTRDDAPGRNARECLRQLEALRALAGGDISKAVPLPGESSIRIELNGVSSAALKEHHLDPSVADHRIIAAASSLASSGEVVLVSNDAAMRIKASVLGLTANEFFEEPPVPLGPGWKDLEATPSAVSALFAASGHLVPIDDLDGPSRAALGSLRENEFAVFAKDQSSALVRRVGDCVRTLPRAHSQAAEAWGIHSRSKEQAFALDLLSDNDVPLVALQGFAGTGKTMLAIASGLQQVFEEEKFSRLTILRPVVSVGRADLGFLPGELEDKLGPWFETVVDTMVALSTSGQTHQQARAQLASWVDQGRLTMEAVTFMRGRSIQNTFMLVDEVQNLEASVVKTLVTRLGSGSKGVFIGDISQVDNPWTSKDRNGLTALIAAFAGEPEFGHVTLTRGERSRVAYLASERM